MAVGAVHLDYVFGPFSSLNLGEGGNVFLFTSRGELFVRQPYDERGAGRDVRRAEVFRRLSRVSSGTFEATAVVDGMSRLYAYRQVGSLPLVISVGLSKSDVNEAWTRIALVVGAAARSGRRGGPRRRRRRARPTCG